jgi:hypothetical protein
MKWFHRPQLFWFLWSVGLLLNLTIAATLRGTMDVLLYGKYGATLAMSDFATAYASSKIYNIPPLAAAYSALLVILAGPTSMAFAFFLKLPGILAEAALAATLWQRSVRSGWPAPGVPMLMALNPIGVAITGFHGNLDGLLAVCIALALLAAVDDRPIACGLWLGLAANLKVSPLLLGPAFFFWWLARGRAQPFTLAAGLTVLVGWSPGLIACPQLFLERVVGYSSVWGTWGISRLLYLTGSPDFHKVGYDAPSALAKGIAAGLKFMVIGASVALAWRRRKLSAHELIGTIAAIWTVFFVIAPGGATQYLIWLVAPYALYRLRLAVVYVVAATPFLYFFYRNASTSFINGAAHFGPTRGCNLRHRIRLELVWNFPVVRAGHHPRDEPAALVAPGEFIGRTAACAKRTRLGYRVSVSFRGFCRGRRVRCPAPW